MLLRMLGLKPWKIAASTAFLQPPGHWRKWVPFETSFLTWHKEDHPGAGGCGYSEVEMGTPLCYWPACTPCNWSWRGGSCVGPVVPHVLCQESWGWTPSKIAQISHHSLQTAWWRCTCFLMHIQHNLRGHTPSIQASPWKPWRLPLGGHAVPQHWHMSEGWYWLVSHQTLFEMAFHQPDLWLFVFGGHRRYHIRPHSKCGWVGTQVPTGGSTSCKD